MSTFLSFVIGSAHAVVTIVAGCLLDTAIQQHYPGTTIGALAALGVVGLVTSVVGFIASFD